MRTVQATPTTGDENPRREYIRHTADVPIEVRTVDGEQASATGLNVSHGGLASPPDDAKNDCERGPADRVGRQADLRGGLWRKAAGWLG